MSLCQSLSRILRDSVFMSVGLDSDRVRRVQPLANSTRNGWLDFKTSASMFASLISIVDFVFIEFVDVSVIACIA